MVKKGFALILCTLCCLLALSGALAEQDQDARVVDLCGLFTEDEIGWLEEKIVFIREMYGMDCAVITSRQVPDNRSYNTEEATRAYADAWYEEHGYGEGEDRAGLLYLIDMNNRLPYISTAGVMIDYISDKRLNQLLDTVDPYLQQGKYGSSAQALLDKLESILAKGIEEGHFRYDSATGERLTGLYNKLTTGEILVAGIAALAVMSVVGFSNWARYNLKRSTYHFNKDTQSSVNMTQDEKTFLRQHVSRTHISSGSRGGGGHGGGCGSGVHFSSGGMSHGGGGGRHF